MLEELINLDKNCFVFLNNLGKPTFDNLWLFITKQINWIPYFALLLYLLYKKVSIKTLGLVLLFIAITILFCDQTSYFFKKYFQRLRPCNDLEIKHLIRIIKHSNTYSFFSGHACSSMGTATFLFFVLKKHYKYPFLLFLFPLIFAYSRIYLGLHFPIDILTGYAFGSLYGLLFYTLFVYTNKKV